MIRLQDKQGRNMVVKEFTAADALSLHLFYQLLSPASRSRFAPHSFQYAALQEMARSTAPDYIRWVVREEGADPLVAYFVLYRGLFEWERHRFLSYNVGLPQAGVCTFAPALADRWQGQGLGSILFREMEKQLAQNGMTHIVLWGGVQSDNAKALRFYQSAGFRPIGQFRYEGRENIDMVKEILKG